MVDLLVAAAADVVGRQHVDRQVLEPGVLRPAQQVRDVLGPGPVPGPGVQTGRLGPAPVAVHHEPDVPRQPRPSYVATEPVGPGALEEVHYLRPSPWKRACTDVGV